MAVLRERSGERVHPLRGKIILIGRDPRCDIVIHEARASAQHALIVKSGSAWFIEDLDSANGTFVNGTRLQQRSRLKPGDCVEIFGLTATFDENAVPPPAHPQHTPLPGLKSTEGAIPSILSFLDVGGPVQAQVAPESKLRAILELSRTLGATLDLEKVLPKILESLFSIFPQAERGFILLHEPSSGQLVSKAVRGRDGQEKGEPQLSRTIIDHALSTRRAILSADAGLDERFDLSKSIQTLHLRSIMCVPLLGNSGSPLGVIQIDTRDANNPFHQEDLDVLLSASMQAARAVELARLHAEWRELEAATQIQKSFLPAERPRCGGLHFFDYYAPAQHVSGDYYDYIPLPGNRLAVALGDVSGKGVSAALLMARLSAAVRFCLATAATVPEAVRQLSAVLNRAGSEDRFITFVVAVLDLASFSMTLVNAGHMPPLRRRTGRPGVEEVGKDAIGLPLAVFDRPYDQTVVALEPGDTLVLYTDGVTEARNPAGALYGEERLQAAVQGAPPEVEALGQTLLAEVRQFAAGRPPSDDLALVCFSRQA
jgi:serine phosphatase RsbU (regulator of sigma subunit)